MTKLSAWFAFFPPFPTGELFKQLLAAGVGTAAVLCTEEILWLLRGLRCLGLAHIFCPGMGRDDRNGGYIFAAA